MKAKILPCLTGLLLCTQLMAENLKPGFIKQEYTELIQLWARQIDTPWTNIKIPEQHHYKMVYRSPEMGLANRWDLWLSQDSIIVISIRGTVGKAQSWLENFYSVMVPSKGKLQIKKGEDFTYNLSNHPGASIHCGWLLATAYLSQDILPKIESYYKLGYKNFIILGHSQGGAIANLFTSMVKIKQEQNQLPSGIIFKTYCSAAPKPGNLYYAYSYESLTYGGWAFNVVNAADWVPETPFNVQTVSDLNKTNPFTNADKIIKRQKFATRWVLRHSYKKMKTKANKSMYAYQKYLGYKTEKLVHKHLPDFVPPEYVKSANYSRAGTHISLVPDEKYYQKFPDSTENLFIHHMLEPYLYLTDLLPP